MVNETGGLFRSTVDTLDGLFSTIFNSLVLSIVIIIVGFVIGKLLGKLIQRLLSEFELNNILKSAVGLESNVEELIGQICSYVIYFLSVVWALQELGLKTYILNIIAAAVLIVIVLSIFLGIKDFVPNVFSGLILHRKGFLKKGDRIKFKGTSGKIIHMNLIETRIKTASGDIIYIPNSFLTKTDVLKKKD